jgi:hypothetical protein
MNLKEKIEQIFEEESIKYGEYFYRNINIEGDKISGEESFHGKDWYNFRASNSLLTIFAAIGLNNQAATQIWQLQDGMPGLDIKDFDWSAIRDSSPEVINKMYQVAIKYVQPAIEALK